MVKASLGKVFLIGFRFLGFFYAFSPRVFQIFYGNTLGIFLCFLGIRKKIVLQNLAFAYPKNQEMQNSLFFKTYLNLGNLFLECFMVLKTPWKTRAPIFYFVKKRVDFEGSEHMQHAWENKKSVIMVASHLGNWEVMSAVAGVFLKTDLMLVTKRIQPQWLHMAIEEGRASYQVHAAYEPKTVQNILAHLKNPRGLVGFILDQYAGAPIGVRVPFFGVPVGTAIAVAMLAKRTGAVVLPVENFRKSNGRWQVKVYPAFEWRSEPGKNLNAELALNTAYFTAFIEKTIYSHPEQWLWIHRRFKGDLSPLRSNEWSEWRVR